MKREILPNSCIYNTRLKELSFLRPITGCQSDQQHVTIETNQDNCVCDIDTFIIAFILEKIFIMGNIL